MSADGQRPPRPELRTGGLPAWLGGRARRAACDETVAELLAARARPDGEARAPLQEATSQRRERVRAHLNRCRDCQLARAQLEQIQGDVRASAPALDDLRRARLASRLAPELDQIAAELAADHQAAARASWRARLSGPRRRWVWPTTAAGAALAAAAVVWTVAGGRPDGDQARGRQVVASAPSPTDRDPLRPPGAGEATTGAVGATATPPGRAPTGSASTDEGSSEGAAVAAGRAAPGPVGSAAGNPGAVVRPGHLALLRPISPASRRTGQATRTGRSLAAAVDHLDVPAGARVRARLGARSWATLVGPARLEITAATAGRIEMRLVRGAVIADWDGRHGDRLRVRSPGAVTEVVGTLFAISADGPQSRIAVAHGRVSVRGEHGAARTVPAGRALHTGDRRGLTTAIAPIDRARLVDHDRALAVLRARPARENRRPGPASAPLPPGASPAEVIYRQAEQALAARDLAGARAHLQRLLAHPSGAPLEDVARYELAQLALRAGDTGEARAQLDDLLASGGEPALMEPARLLRCELILGGGEREEARRCLEGLRSSSREATRRAALGHLVRLYAPDGACREAAPVAAQYLRLARAGREAAQAETILRRCQP